MKRIFVLTLLVLLTLFLVACGSKYVRPSSTSTVQPTLRPTATPKPTPTPRPKTLKQELDELVQNADHRDPNARTELVDTSYMVTEDFNQLALLDNSSMVEDFKQDCYNLQRAIWTNSVSKRLTQAEVIFTLDTQDKYGKVYPHTEVGSCTLTKKTAALFHWDNLIADETWSLYDNTFLIPFLTS